MKLDYMRTATLLKYGKTVDVSDYTVSQLIRLQHYLKSSNICYSKKYDPSNYKLYLVSYKDLMDLVSKNREVL